MCLCDVILLMSGIFFVSSVIFFFLTRKIGKDNNSHQSCKGDKEQDA